jgi:Bacterial SH3 domain
MAQPVSDVKIIRQYDTDVRVSPGICRKPSSDDSRYKRVDGQRNARYQTWAGDSPPATDDVLAPKIANVRLMAEPSDTSKVVATLARGEELVVIGAVKDGFVKVQSAATSGWVKMVLVTRR